MMWCVKCRAKTEDADTDVQTSKNGRPMLVGRCVACGTAKRQFIKRETADRHPRGGCAESG